MVRIATLDDFELICKMATNFVYSSGYLDYVEAPKLQDTIINFLTSDPSERVVFICDDIGMLAAFITPFTFGSQKMAVEFGWWVEQDQRGRKAGSELKNAFEDWAKEQGCSLITMICLDDIVGELYQKWGYKLYERTYMKEI